MRRAFFLCAGLVACGAAEPAPVTVGIPPVAAPPPVPTPPPGVPEACWGPALRLDLLDAAPDACAADAEKSEEAVPGVRAEIVAPSTTVGPGGELALTLRLVNTTDENRELWLRPPARVGDKLEAVAAAHALDDKGRNVDVLRASAGFGGFGDIGSGTSRARAVARANERGVRVVLAPRGVATTTLTWKADGYDQDPPPPTPTPPPKPPKHPPAPAPGSQAARQLKLSHALEAVLVPLAFPKRRPLPPGDYRVVVTSRVRGVPPAELPVKVSR